MDSDRLGAGPRPRPCIEQITPYVGGESEAQTARVHCLASNEGALGPSPLAMEAYGALANTLHRYPDGGSIGLRRALAARWSLDVDRIVCGAGSDELIGLLVRAYAGPGDEVLHCAHGFLMYRLSALAAGAEPISVPESHRTADIDAILGAVTERSKIVFLANPNNPTGTYLDGDALARLHAGLASDVLLVIDSAYAEYAADAPGYSDGADLVEAADNVVMLRTFSKIFALAALRLGWAYCPPGIADTLNRVRGPFNVSLAAQQAGIAALADRAFLEKSVEHNRQWRAVLTQNLRGLGLAVADSVANFVLVDFADRTGANRTGADRTGATASQALAFLQERGVLVRGMAGYGLPDCLRIGVGTAEDVRAVTDGLSAFLTGS